MTTTQVPIIGWEKRYMTARECARLQSMDSLNSLPKGIAAMHALGNAVNVTVVQHILSRMIPLLRKLPTARETISPLRGDIGDSNLRGLRFRAA